MENRLAILLALTFVFDFVTVAFAERASIDEQPRQASPTASRKARAKKRSPKPRRSIRNVEKMKSANTAANQEQMRQPTREAIDPADVPPGEENPTLERLPDVIDPAEMPPSKKPAKPKPTPASKPATNTRQP